MKNFLILCLGKVHWINEIYYHLHNYGRVFLYGLKSWDFNAIIWSIVVKVEDTIKLTGEITTNKLS